MQAQFRPVLYCFSFSESAIGFKLMLSTLKTGWTLFRYDVKDPGTEARRMLTVHGFCTDYNNSFKNAYEEEIKFNYLDYCKEMGQTPLDPASKRMMEIMTTCWPHVIRNARDDHSHLLENKENIPEVMGLLNMLHLCPSKRFFHETSLYVLRRLEWALKEVKFADWFNNVYLKEPWNCWYISASGYPGCCPNNNAQESWHKQTKANHLPKARMPHDSLFTTGFPNMVKSLVSM